MKKYLFGSKLLKLENNRDEDWITFEDAPTKIANEHRCHSIPFFKDLLKYFSDTSKVKSNSYNARYLYQLSNGFITDPDYPFEYFNILENKTAWIGWIKAYMNDPKTEQCAIQGEVLPKQFYHILYQYYMIKENAHFISDTSKVLVQKIHDLEVASSYFYELRDLINSL